jgi:pyruvate,water dikinase
MRWPTFPGPVRDVWWSANSDSAITYRQRVGLFTRPSVGVVVQTLLDPVVAGVMFTEHPVTGADERLVEASWGLGEAVVAGLVIPDHFRLDRAGSVLERKAGRKRIAIRSLPSGGTFEQQVPPAQANQLVPRRQPSSRRWASSPACEKVYGPRRDIEWAFQDGTLYLLQCRAVTTGKARSERRRPARPRATPWPPSSASSSSPTWTAGRPSRSPACSRSAASRRARPSSWRAPGRRLLHHRLRGGHGLEQGVDSPPSARATTSARSP